VSGVNDTTALATRLSGERFVSLTTYKRSGEAVATPMWIVRDGAQLSVWTPADSWKVKRARRDPRVTLRACGRTGKVASGQPVLAGTAEVVTDPGEVSRVETLVKQKYGLEFRVMTFIETIAARGRKSRVLLRISPQPTKGS
jgi:PPOX class probable F420-dependent enzyme